MGQWGNSAAPASPERTVRHPGRVPSPSVRRAVDSVDGSRALVVGDAVWDMESARRAGYPAIGLLTGGVAGCELLAAGAASVHEDPATLVAGLDGVLDEAR